MTGQLVISASEMAFDEALPTGADGKPRRRGHHYAWGRCSECGELRLTARAGLARSRCRITPRCKGLLAPAEDAQAFLAGPVARAMVVFDAIVIGAFDLEAIG